MIRNVYSIRDQKTRAFDAPLQFENDATAQRFFSRAIENVPLLSENPKDFDLYHVGTFCSETGTIAPNEHVQLLFNGLDCVKSIEKGSTHATTKVSNDAPIQPSAKGGDSTVNI